MEEKSANLEFAPNHLHFEINKQTLLHGKHLLSEKPLTLSSEEAKELYELSQEKGLRPCHSCIIV
ncbi:Gfo/Idh/MocA family oxidoreductase [Paenibacillus qinlingensis]|uniref:Gfo/Idh/MocA family oxidoreductase n=1 Tax=Paenibacillus qinlingensis TaxID=1837343 RepID=UPI00236862C4|nr:Gfo/Idh/MocA family oxidoreductase [Paenibacillus qinlingensis]